MAHISLVFLDTREFHWVTNPMQIYMSSKHSTHSRINIWVYQFFFVFLSDGDAEVASKRGQILSADITTINLATTDNNKNRRKSLPLERHFLLRASTFSTVVVC